MEGHVSFLVPFAFQITLANYRGTNKLGIARDNQAKDKQARDKQARQSTGLLCTQGQSIKIVPHICLSMNNIIECHNRHLQFGAL